MTKMMSRIVPLTWHCVLKIARQEAVLARIAASPTNVTWCMEEPRAGVALQ
jgi:hypothetical protein